MHRMQHKTWNCVPARNSTSFSSFFMEYSAMDRPVAEQMMKIVPMGCPPPSFFRKLRAMRGSSDALEGWFHVTTLPLQYRPVGT